MWRPLQLPDSKPKFLWSLGGGRLPATVSVCNTETRPVCHVFVRHLDLLTQFTDKVLSNMDKGLVNGVVFIDLKKAFDTVDHVILLGKLKSLGLSSKNLEWFHSYLSSRYQKTVIGQASSTSRKVSVGVPVGSILGPLLFVIYMNDLPKVLRNTTVTLFADDTALYCSSQSARDLQTMLNQDLDRLAQWLYEHKLTLNVSKSKFMLIGGPRKLNTLKEFTLTIKEKE